MARRYGVRAIGELTRRAETLIYFWSTVFHRSFPLDSSRSDPTTCSAQPVFPVPVFVTRSRYSKIETISIEFFKSKFLLSGGVVASFTGTHSSYE